MMLPRFNVAPVDGARLSNRAKMTSASRRKIFLCELTRDPVSCWLFGNPVPGCIGTFLRLWPPPRARQGFLRSSFLARVSSGLKPDAHAFLPALEQAGSPPVKALLVHLTVLRRLQIVSL